MPGQPSENYYSDTELAEMVRKLNALTSEWTPWQETRARKEHDDLFGEAVQSNETYFKREASAAYEDVIKLSRVSMERLLYALFRANPDLERFAEQRCQLGRRSSIGGGPPENLP